ncbi:MAG: 4Fe-4S dicluster domain-containing protein [Planctomycetales bacterium]|nr:4Fe-4S dicluster domain-containing protein [Planctomycetales bacterium]
MLHQINSEALGPRGKAMAHAVGTCVHCGFCLPACPTYQELESEMDSPRGRILLMKSVLEGEIAPEEAEVHIDRCLGCLACVSHCPSGVPYGDLISSFRAHALTSGQKKRTLRDWLLSSTLPYGSRFRIAVRLGQLGRHLSRLMPEAFRPMLELVPREIPAAISIPELSPALGLRRGRVALVAGCAQQVIAPDINAATIRVLNRNGIEVVTPRLQGCCGALDWHTGNSSQAAKFAQDLMSVMPTDVDCVITNAAGCGSAIHEYGLLLAGTKLQAKAEEFASRVLDVSVYLSQLDLEPIPTLNSQMRVAYHDACHLAHAQGVKAEPRHLLAQIPGLEVIDLADSDTCCGSAGTYNIEQPEIARALGRRKAHTIMSSGAQAVVTGNIGCLVQIEKHLASQSDRVAVFHTLQILDRAYQKILN